jgi:hypothetical protein
MLVVEIVLVVLFMALWRFSEEGNILLLPVIALASMLAYQII